MNSLAIISNLMSGDGLIIFVFILLFFGAKRLPELARGLGSAVREFAKAKDEIEHEITRAPQIEAPRDTYAQQPQGYTASHATEAPVVGLTGDVPVTPPVVAPPTAAPVEHAPITEEHQHQTSSHPVS